MIFDIDSFCDDFSPTNLSNSDLIFTDRGFSSDKLFFFHQNVRSLIEICASLVSHVDLFACVPNVIFIFVIWIYDFVKNEYFIPGFSLFAKTFQNPAAGRV